MGILLGSFGGEGGGSPDNHGTKGGPSKITHTHTSANSRLWPQTCRIEELRDLQVRDHHGELV